MMPLNSKRQLSDDVNYMLNRFACVQSIIPLPIIIQLPLAYENVRLHTFKKIYVELIDSNFVLLSRLYGFVRVDPITRKSRATSSSSLFPRQGELSVLS